MAKSKPHYDEIDDIREDLDSLKDNIVELTKHVQKDGKAEIHSLQNLAEDRLEDITQASKEQYKSLRKNVKAKPERALAIAFAGGLLASYLMARR